MFLQCYRSLEIIRQLKKVTMMADCDSIATLVDMLGTIDLLAAAASTTNTPVEVYEHHNAAAAKSDKNDGLHYSGAHWYSRKGSSITDSYTEKYQIAGTAHFCQSFAVMIHLGNANLDSKMRLQPNEYAKNIEKAMDFWINFFTTNAAFKKWLTDQFTGWTPTKLMNEFLDVRGSAASLVGCKYEL